MLPAGRGIELTPYMNHFWSQYFLIIYFFLIIIAQTNAEGVSYPVFLGLFHTTGEGKYENFFFEFAYIPTEGAHSDEAGNWQITKISVKLELVEVNIYYCDVRSYSFAESGLYCHE